MSDWHKFVKDFYKKKKESDPKYYYWEAMQEASIPYKKFKIEQRNKRKEIGKKLHLIRDPLIYIMPDYLNTYDKITLKLSSDFFTNVKLNKSDCKLLYLENRQKIKKEKNDKKFAKSIIALQKHLPFRQPSLIRPLRNFPLLNRVRNQRRQPLTRARLRELLSGTIHI